MLSFDMLSVLFTGFSAGSTPITAMRSRKLHLVYHVVNLHQAAYNSDEFFRGDSAGNMEYKLDCVYYLGEKPCRFKRLCMGCPEYKPMGTRILILKLGAMGDALRTTPVLSAIRRTYSHTHITWLTDRTSLPILQLNPEIDYLGLLEPSDMNIILGQHFHLLLSLDKAIPAIAFAMQVQADQRRGYAMSPYGTLDVFNDAALYSLALGLDDDLKFNHNAKTYQQTIHELCEIDYRRDPYVFQLPDESRSEAARIIENLTLRGQGPRIGLNTGCGDVFATKKWPDKHFVELARLLHHELDARVFFLGGAAERASNRRMVDEVGDIAAEVGAHPLNVFAGLLHQMDIVVTGDTMALHLAIAVQTPVVGLFGPTCHQEIDFYDLGQPLVVSDSCAPCYRRTCVRAISCMHSLTPRLVAETVKKLFLKGPDR